MAISGFCCYLPVPRSPAPAFCVYILTPWDSFVSSILVVLMKQRDTRELEHSCGVHKFWSIPTDWRPSRGKRFANFFDCQTFAFTRKLQNANVFPSSQACHSTRPWQILNFYVNEHPAFLSVLGETVWGFRLERKLVSAFRFAPSCFLALVFPTR